MADAPSGKSAANRLHLLKLSDESAHVRSLARSWAAGEVSVDDYRMIRALTIEGMLSGVFASEISDDVRMTESLQQPLDEDHDITAVGDPTVTRDDDDDHHGQAPAAVSSVPRVALITGAALLLLGLILLFTLV